MARRIRWQIVIAAFASLLVLILLTTLALSNTTVARPLSGGTYVEVVTDYPQQVVPLLNVPLSDPTGRDVGNLLFDGLTRIGVDGLPEPSLAESWEIDDTGKIYTFHLHPGVTWHDGKPFTADDVVFTIESIQNSRFVGDPTISNLWRNVLVERVDDMTVRCTLNAPYAPFLSAASIAILPAHVLADVDVEEWAESSFAQKPIGTGPYQFTERTVEYISLAANEEYFGGKPFIEQIRLQFIDSTGAAFAALSRDHMYALGINASPETSRIALPANFRRVFLPLDAYAMLSFNLRESPLQDLEVRQALSRGLDKDLLIEQALGGSAARLDTPILPGWYAYDPNVQWYAYDLEAAGVALDSLGYTLSSEGIREQNGEPLRFSLLTDGNELRRAAAQEIVRQWRLLGVQVEIEELESAELRNRLRSHDFSMAIHGWARLGADPDVFELWHSTQAANGANYAGLMDNTIDKVLINARIEQDLLARSEQYATFQQRWVELVPGIMLYQPLYMFVASDELGGLGFDSSVSSSNQLLIGQEDRYRNITRWFIRSSREIRGTVQ